MNDPIISSYIHSDASPENPIYRKILTDPNHPTKLYFIICDEGWRESIVCSGMYEWTVDWLLEVIGRKPYALGQH